jgi:hypothetical protein
MIKEISAKTSLVTILLVLLTVIQVVELMDWLPSNTQDQPSIRTLPILSPVSLKYEEELRSGKQPANLHAVVNRVLTIDPSQVPKEQVQQFMDNRLSMLTLRNERHQLNVRLMESGVSLLETLTPEQWEFVQSQRDQIQATHEMAAMEQLLQKWSD